MTESETFSSEPPLLVVAAMVGWLPILHTKTGPVVGDFENTAFVGLLLLLPLLLLLLNLEPGFDAAAPEDDDKDDSFGDPDSTPFVAFPVPAFNGEYFTLLINGLLVLLYSVSAS
ncbi:hypothetical protein SLA2020_222110 [Shorea laevis]